MKVMMRITTGACSLFGLAVVGALSPRADAGIHATFIAVPYSAAAIAHDPVLANMQTWDIRVTTDGNWASAGLRATLPTGQTFYKNALGSNTKPNPAFIAIAPSLEFTTYVTSPADTGATGAPSVLGGFPEGTPASLGDSTSSLPGVFSMSWGDLINDPPGTYQIARLTFGQSTFFNILDILETGPTGNYSKTSQVNPDSSTPIVFPEPAAAVSIALAGLLVGMRRRRR